jgi:hypothetical protein
MGNIPPKPEDPHKELKPNDPITPNNSLGSARENGQVTFPPLPPPSPIGDKPAAAGSEIK